MPSIIPKPLREIGSGISDIRSARTTPGEKKAGAERLIKAAIRISLVGLAALAVFKLGLAAAPIAILGSLFLSLPQCLDLALIVFMQEHLL